MGSKIKELRQVMGISQEQLAKKASISQSKVSKVELGTQPPGVELFKYVKVVFEIAKQILEEERSTPKL